MQPIVSGLEDEYKGKVNFLYLNATAEGRSMYDSLSLPGHPSTLVFKVTGQESFRAFGILETDQIRDELERVIQLAAPSG